MAVRGSGQLSLADGLTRQRGRSGITLDKLAALLDWQAIQAVLKPVEPSRNGAPGYPALLMFRALLLQQWHDLSDPALEDALSDRLSFRRFVGLALDEAVPDHSTISRFRTALAEHKLSEDLFSEVLRQIDARKLILRRGTMIDATLIEAAVKRPEPPAPGEIAVEPPPAEGDGEAPTPQRPPSKLVGSQVDADAAWAKKGNKRIFGYKGHVGVDHGTGFIRTRLFTPASVADTTAADGLICGDEQAVYADKAYDTKARRAALKAVGTKDRIAHRPNKHHRLSHWQERRNAGISWRRSGVERVFAIAKHLMGWRRVRYIGLARNGCHFDLLCMAINLRRLIVVAG